MRAIGMALAIVIESCRLHKNEWLSLSGAPKNDYFDHYFRLIRWVMSCVLTDILLLPREHPLLRLVVLFDNKNWHIIIRDPYQVPSLLSSKLKTSTVVITPTHFLIVVCHHYHVHHHE